jgi:tetratricopeptide (TPR) repeat protein
MTGKRGAMALVGISAALLGFAGCAWHPSSVNPLASLSGKPGLPPDSPNELPAAQAIQACLAVGQNLEKSNNDVAAIDQYERILRLDPNNQKASRRLAVLYDRCCDYAKADAEYQKLAKARPRDADLFNDWGYSYYQRTKWQDAEKCLRKAVELDPQQARARCNLGLALGQQGRYDEAFQQFRSVVGEAEAHCNLAFVYWTQGKLEEARRECHNANQINPSCTKSLDMLAALDLGAKPEDSGEKLAASSSRRNGDRRRPSREQLELEARAMLSKMNGTPPGRDAAPPTNDEPRPVYKSPNGTVWVPVTPKKAAEPAAPAADGVSGSIMWE